MTIELCPLCGEHHEVMHADIGGCHYSSCIHLQGDMVVDMEALQSLCHPLAQLLDAAGHPISR